ncbi:MAG: hypothetical protein ACXWPM_01645, partial [Bdellovibrionota bacterium]
MNRGLQYLRNYGLKATAMAAVRSSRTRLKNLFSEPDRSLPYRFATHPIPYAHSAPEAAGRRVNWVIPGFYRGSGGHTTIFRISELLEKQGYDVHFYIMGPTMYANDHEATHSMRTHYFPLKGMVHIDLTQMRPADTCIASAWETAYAVRDFKACRRKIYFV